MIRTKQRAKVVHTPEPQTLAPADDREWLEADGLGGFASGRADGTRSRRYHALLLCATKPPTERVALVQAVEAWLVMDGERFPLSTSVYQDGSAYPNGREFLREFQHAPWPRWSYEVAKGVIVDHELFVPRGKSAVLLSWRLRTRRANCTLEVRPLLSGRDAHALHHENPSFDFRAQGVADGLSLRPYASLPAIFALSNGRFEFGSDWYRNFLLTDERDRGFDHLEDLASVGTFNFDLSRSEANLVFGTEQGVAEIQDGEGLFVARVAALRRAELKRRLQFSSQLARAAESYIVQRGNGSTIIAGYPWFGDWGRDTFIALRGLCLATGRIEDARSVLLEWAQHVCDGMLPNRFPDAGGAPEYNSVDAALWFVIGVYELRAAFTRAKTSLSRVDNAALSRAIEAILDGHLAGTRHGIGQDTDGLLRAGVAGVQLTWMDAKVEERVITPRIGKPVEIEALWLNALWIAAQTSPKYRKPFESGLKSFQTRFFDEARGCLYDVVDCDHVPGTVDARLRPNQLLAIGGLPLQLLDRKRARSVVDVVEQELWTPVGPRSLSPKDAEYVGRYEGGPRERDAVYHQGAVWPWLAGPFVEAWVRARGCTNAARKEARKRFLTPLLKHLDSAGLGHVSEIADGDSPHRPRGCPFQAWSLGELIRLDFAVLVETKDDSVRCDALACAQSGCKQVARRR